MMHVLPVDDLVEHTSTDDCVCGPQVVPVERPDGTIGWVTVHMALDGRQ